MAITPKTFRERLKKRLYVPTTDRHSVDFLHTDGTVKTLRDMSKELIEFALRHHNLDMSASAAALGVSRPTLYARCREYGITG